MEQTTAQSTARILTQKNQKESNQQCIHHMDDEDEAIHPIKGFEHVVKQALTCFGTIQCYLHQQGTRKHIHFKRCKRDRTAFN